MRPSAVQIVQSFFLRSSCARLIRDRPSPFVPSLVSFAQIARGGSNSLRIRSERTARSILPAFPPLSGPAENLITPRNNRETTYGRKVAIYLREDITGFAFNSLATFHEPRVNARPCDPLTARSNIERAPSAPSSWPNSPAQLPPPRRLLSFIFRDFRSIPPPDGTPSDRDPLINRAR